MTDIPIPLPWAVVAPCSRVMLPSGRVVHVQHVTSAPNLPTLVGLRNDVGQDAKLIVGPDDLALTLVGPQDIAVRTLAAHFPGLTFLRSE